MKDIFIERTTNFRWNSRFELYEFFKDKYGIDSNVIDQIILIC